MCRYVIECGGIPHCTHECNGCMWWDEEEQ